MIGRFIFECDLANISLAGSAAKYLMDHPEYKDVITTYGPRDTPAEVTMFSKRLKKSIRVMQVKP